MIYTGWLSCTYTCGLIIRLLNLSMSVCTQLRIDTIRCVKFIRLRFFKQLRRLMTILLFFFVMPLKYNGGHASDSLIFLTRSCDIYLLS